MSDPHVTDSDQSSATGSDQGGSNTGGTNPPSNNPPPNPPNHSAGTGTHTNSPDLTAVLTALTALPEQMARSVREAIGTPAKPTDKPTDKPADKPDDKPVDKPTDKPADKSSTPGRKSFAEWWGGK